MYNVSILPRKHVKLIRVKGNKKEQQKVKLKPEVYFLFNYLLILILSVQNLKLTTPVLNHDSQNSFKTILA